MASFQMEVLTFFLWMDFWTDLSVAKSIRELGFGRDKGGPIITLALICSQDSSGW
jgi:hypothetical protein